MVAASLIASAVRADLYNTNLLLNPGAEVSPGSPDGSTVVPVANWTTFGNFTVMQYGSASGMLTNAPGAAKGGSNLFSGGPNTALSTAWQDVSVSTIAADIDADLTVCTLSGWLGGWQSQDDNARLTAYFLNLVGQTNGSCTIGPVLASDRANVTGLYFRQGTARLPTGTRVIRCSLAMTRANSGYNDGYADSLSLVLSNSPPPSTPDGTNLLVNGDAEAGPGSLDGAAVAPVPGWTTAGACTATQYGTGSGILTNAPGPTTRGANFFSGGLTTSPSVAVQEVEVTGRAADIDAGTVECTLTGWLGGWLDQDDNARLTAYFLNRGGQTNGSLTIGPILAADRTNITSLLYRRAETNVPPTTRTIRCVLVMTWASGSYNDGYADNLSLTISTPPRLAIAAAGNSALLSWPIWAGAWTLQTASHLPVAPTDWLDLPLPYQTNGSTVSQTVPGLNISPLKFFRLRK